LDEIDSLQNQTLISVLRQLRAGYPRRPRNFPASLALIGMRDVRDYKVASGGSERLNTASPFNIKVASLTMGNFTAEEVAKLYQQHSDATGQLFTPEAVQRAFELTEGQPWLVNALAYVITETILPQSTELITRQHIDEASQILIKRQDTHLDSLAERLQEARVRRVIEPILAGSELYNTALDDIRFVIDLGLCRMNPYGGLEIANPIYKEVLPRVLSTITTASLPLIQPIWLKENGRLDPHALLNAFLAFWRRHGEPLLKSAHYHEIAPHLVLMAFLHRVANAGGTVEREYAIGSGRMDICLHYGDDTVAMELKVWRDKQKDPLQEGLRQLDKYLNGLSLETGWLVIFDRRSGLSPIAERTVVETAVSPANRSITVIRG
jgi:hypothetical protein